METCNLVNALGIIIAQFAAGEKALAGTGMVEYRGKFYARRFESGGGAPSYYEVRADVVLRDQDVSKKI